MKRADQVAGFLLLGLGVAFAAGGSAHPYWGPGGPGSGFLPVWLGLAMAALAGVLLVQAFRAREPGPSWLARGAGLRRLAAVLGISAAFVAALKVTGMALGTVLFLVAILRFIEGYRWASTVAIAVGAAAFNYLVFTYWLRVPFPTGIFGL